jgi:hypothetical protein
MKRLLALFVGLCLTATAAAQTAPIFKDAKLRTQEGEKTKETDVRLRYDETSLSLLPSGGKKELRDTPIRTIAYTEITAAEYTFGKSPRVTAALLVSPLFLFNSSKSHWLTVKTANDYANLRLDKSNYKLVMAELEKRSKITVESVGEDK